MQKHHRFISVILVILLFFIGSCSPKTVTPTLHPSPVQTEQVTIQPTPSKPMQTPTVELKDTRLLSICLGQEPRSLFLYAGTSSAERSILQAIYDGPYDIRGYQYRPVIMEKVPSLADGDASLEKIEVKPGDLIVDNSGKWANLGVGVTYRPTGCKGQECAQSYSGSSPVEMDRLVVRFKLKPGLSWSDGSSLSADDSVFSFEVARKLYPAYMPDLIHLTQSYQAIDPVTIEWKGAPGFQGPGYQSFFFTPLPRHAWNSIAPDDLATAPPSAQTPIGWGPYMIEEWIQGDHLTLAKNPRYFRASEGLPHFDKLVFRFVSTPQEALDALQAGECDLADESTQLETQASTVFDLQNKGKVVTAVQVGAAWEQLSFGIAPFDEKKPKLFAQPNVRKAVAMCIDRSKIAAEQYAGKAVALDSYLLPDHPLYNAKEEKIPYEPQKASEMLTAAGWIDTDSNPVTPRLSQGVPGVPDGIPFQVSLAAADDPGQQHAATMIQESLAQCGIKVDLNLMGWDQLLAAGPEGPVFGRKFDLALFAWTTTLEPACNLFLGEEIPGPYPQFPKGWGGANPTGFDNPEYDQACRQANTLFPELPDYTVELNKAQAILSQQLPAIPLYSQVRLVAGRADLCGLDAGDPLENSLWNLESLDYGNNCK